MGYEELPDRKLNEQDDVDIPVKKATTILLDVRTNTPVGYEDDDELRRKIEGKLYDATVITNYVRMACNGLNSKSAWKKLDDVETLEASVYGDYQNGRLPRAENDPTGIPGKDPDLATEDDYTAEDYDED